MSLTAEPTPVARESRPSVMTVPLQTWHAFRSGDETVVARCTGPTLDVGCGPGRMAHALATAGVPSFPYGKHSWTCVRGVREGKISCTVVCERDMFSAKLVSSPADVMITIWNEDSINESLTLATELRSKGLRVDLFPEADKLAKQFKYASSRDIPFVAIVGDDESARGEVAIKDLRSGEQVSVKRDDLASVIREAVKSESRRDGRK